ncbi:MAG: ATP-binding cassette domain-containing protein [Propionibacteriaceae bacterium]|nr:ATP-binding cassette domain-containing protein [Propionibacteriaceae bacterium]
MANALSAQGVHAELGGFGVLHGVDLDIAAGETVALLGGNGSGKTTLLRTVLGLVPLTAGSVTLYGTPLAQFNDWWRIGYVPQLSATAVTKATVAEIVASGRLARRRMLRPPSAADHAAIRRALETMRLTELAGNELAELSGGQRQRAIVARALAGEPDLLLLDEPLAGLDTRSQDALAAMLAELKLAGLTICVVLHELGPMADLIDNAAVLRDGQRIFFGKLAGSHNV